MVRPGAKTNHRRVRMLHRRERSAILALKIGSGDAYATSERKMSTAETPEASGNSSRTVGPAAGARWRVQPSATGSSGLRCSGAWLPTPGSARSSEIRERRYGPTSSCYSIEGGKNIDCGKVFALAAARLCRCRGTVPLGPPARFLRGSSLGPLSLKLRIVLILKALPRAGLHCEFFAQRRDVASDPLGWSTCLAPIRGPCDSVCLATLILVTFAVRVSLDGHVPGFIWGKTGSMGEINGFL